MPKIPKRETKRYYLIDSIRGLAIINMIFYHLIFDLVYLYNFNWIWFKGIYAFIWEQGICWTFIIISGMSQNLSHHPYRDFFIIFFSGVLVSVVTYLFSPEVVIYFGILSLLSVSILLLTVLKKYFSKIDPYIGFVIFIILFVVTRNINFGYLGFGEFNFYKLPDFLYPQTPGWIQTFIGFTPHSFYSSDYFSLVPWFFLFVVGFYLFRVLNKSRNSYILKKKGNRYLAFLGRHSLLIYLLHQPIIVLILSIIF